LCPIRLPLQLPARRECFVSRLPSPQHGKSLPGAGAASEAEGSVWVCGLREASVELLRATEGAIGICMTPPPHREKGYPRCHLGHGRCTALRDGRHGCAGGVGPLNGRVEWVDPVAAPFAEIGEALSVESDHALGLETL
jgi:hypothetical protein